MEQFAYASPKNLKDALGMLGSDWNDAAVLAGGTDLISLMKDYVVSPKKVVNLKGIKKLHGITQKGADVHIGAVTTLDELTSSPVIRSQFPSLITAAMGAWMIWEARNLGLPKWQMWRMAANVGFDTAIGAVPVVGDLFDFAFRSNSKNLRIIKRHLDRHHPATQVIEG